MRFRKYLVVTSIETKVLHRQQFIRDFGNANAYFTGQRDNISFTFVIIYAFLVAVYQNGNYKEVDRR
jgi:hypothetical protein